MSSIKDPLADIIDLSRYEAFCKTNWGPGVGDNPLYFALGLAGECGEVCEEIKKATRDKRPINREKLSKELGDVLWYLTNIATTNDISLQEVIEQNMRKLNERHGGMYQANRGDSEVGYRTNGPHIEQYEKKTGKHIKFVKKSEMPKAYQDGLDWSKHTSFAHINTNDDIPPWEE